MPRRNINTIGSMEIWEFYKNVQYIKYKNISIQDFYWFQQGFKQFWLDWSSLIDR